MSDNVFIGFVVKIFKKEGVGKRGPWAAYSAKLETAEGEELSRWFRLGFKEPTIKEGDYVKFTCSKVDEGAAKVEDYKVNKNPPERKKAKAGSSNTGGGSGYNSDEGRTDRAYHAARGSAIDMVSLLLGADALPITKAANKGGAAKRYDEITAAVDKLTVKFFRDEFPDYDSSFRLLKDVADEGSIKEEKVSQLPEDAEEDEEIPFDEDDPGFPDEDDDGFE